MANIHSGPGADAAPLNLFARFIGILTSPRDTYRSVAAHPRWFGMLALTSVIVAVGAAAPMMTEAGQLSALDNQVRQMESFGMTVTDEMYANMQRGAGRMAYTAGGSILVVGPIMATIIAGILFLVFNVAMGGDASFRQAFAIVVHAGVISAVAQFFTAPLNIAMGEVTSKTNLAVLLPMIEDTSFLGRLLGAVDVFLIWWVVVLAIGLAVLYRRRTQPIAFSLLTVYAVIALGIAAVMSRFGGTN